MPLLFLPVLSLFNLCSSSVLWLHPPYNTQKLNVLWPSTGNMDVTLQAFKITSVVIKTLQTGLSYIYFLSAKQVNDVNFENMSNDDAVRILREIVSKPG